MPHRRVPDISRWLAHGLEQDGWEDVGVLKGSNVIAVVSCGLAAPALSLNYLRYKLWHNHGIPSRLGATFMPFNKNFVFEPCDALAVPLITRIKDTMKEFPKSRILLIGQSLGGWASLKAMELLWAYPEFYSRIVKVVMLGAPVYATKLKIFTAQNRCFSEEAEKIFSKVERNKLVAIHAKGDEIVGFWHSHIPRAVNIMVDTGHDTISDKLLEFALPFYGFAVRFIPRRHIALAWHDEVPKIIAHHTPAAC